MVAPSEDPIHSPVPNYWKAPLSWPFGPHSLILCSNPTAAILMHVVLTTVLP